MTISVSTTTGNREMYVCVSGKKMMPREWEAQWWLSKCHFYCLGKTLTTSTAFLWKRMIDFNSTIRSMYNIGHFLFTGAGWACGIPSVFTQIYLCFSAAEDFFSAMLDWRGCVFTQLCLWPGLFYLPLRFIIFSSLSSLYPSIVITLLRLCNYLK